MKELFFIIALFAIFSSCNKSNSTPNKPDTDTVWDKITIIDDGITYTDSQVAKKGNMFMGCSLQNDNIFTLGTIPSKGYPSSYPISMAIGSAKNTISEPAIYRERPNENHSNDCIILEDFGVHGFNNIDSIEVHLTTVLYDTLAGNFIFWIKNDSGNRTITGTFSFYDARI